MRSFWQYVLAVCVLLLVAGQAHAYAPPPLQGAVTDTAGKLTAEDDIALEAKLAAHRAATGHEIVVFVVGSLGADSIEDVAYGAFNTWHIGKAGQDNGVLLVIAPNDRKTRIETGKGVGHLLTDVQSAVILRDHVQPLLKQEKFREAVDTGIDSIAATLGGRELPRPAGGLSPGAELALKIVCGVAAALAVGLLIFTFFFFRRARKREMERAIAAGEPWPPPRSASSGSGGSSYSSGSSGSSGGGGYSGGGGSSGGGGASGSY